MTKTRRKCCLFSVSIFLLILFTNKKLRFFLDYMKQCGTIPSTKDNTIKSKLLFPLWSFFKDRSRYKGIRVPDPSSFTKRPLGSFTCPVYGTDTRETTSWFLTSSSQIDYMRLTGEATDITGEQNREAYTTYLSKQITKEGGNEKGRHVFSHFKQHFEKANIYKSEFSNESRGQICINNSMWNELISEKLITGRLDMKNWKYETTVECPHFNVSETNYKTPRLKLSLDCQQSADKIVSLTWTNDNSDIFVVPFGDKCVSKFVEQCCKGGYSVPNVVHYVWYRKRELTFDAFISILSVLRFIKPCMIIIHGDRIPSGKYWNYIVNISPKIIHMKHALPEAPFGQRLAYKEHVGDIIRIEALLIYGGIYMDTDQLIVKSIDSYRNYPTFMSYLNNGLMGCFYIMAQKNATFLHLWLDGYRFHYNPSFYVYNSMLYPNIIAGKHRDLIHTEYGTISRPLDLHDVDIYDTKYGTYNWSSIYGIHLFSRIMREPFNEFTVRTMKTIVGSICRHVIFGNKELCH